MLFRSRKRERIRKAPGLKLERLEKELGRAAQRLRKPGSAHRTFYTSMGAVEWHGSGVLSSFSLPLGYIVRPICGRVYPNDGHAVENQVERNTTGQMALMNVNGELDR